MRTVKTVGPDNQKRAPHALRTGQSAGQLIDRAGLKGLRIGGAYVSDRHANFIMAEDGAKADDVRKLIEAVREKVRATHGVRLTPEIQIW